jgi:hypothetical protein
LYPPFIPRFLRSVLLLAEKNSAFSRQYLKTLVDLFMYV